MKRFLIVAAIAVALALPASAFAQGCTVTGSELSPGITAQVYGNIVEVVAPNGAGCWVTVRVKNEEGDVLAEQSGYLPFTFDWDHGYRAFFLTDWSKKAEFFGIQPGQQIEVSTDYLPVEADAVGITVPGDATHTVAEIGLTKVSPRDDDIAGFVKPRMGTDVEVSFLGLDMNAGMLPGLAPDAGSPVCLGMKISLEKDGTFAEDLSGECNLLRNGAMIVAYYRKNFRIYRFQHIPGVAAVLGTPFALQTGAMYVPYRAHLSGRSGHKAWAKSSPIGWLNLGLYQFSRQNSAVPIRKNDNIHVSQFAAAGNLVEGEEFHDNVPNFFISTESFAAGVAGPAPDMMVINAPYDKLVCFAAVRGTSIGALACTQARPPKPAPTGALAAAATGQIFVGPADAVIAVMQKANGNFYVAHKGLQNPLGFLLTEAPILPSMYGFELLLRCEVLDGFGSCPADSPLTAPRLARAELLGFLK